jgi:hypothetical protein
MIKIVDGIEVEMTAEEIAELAAAQTAMNATPPLGEEDYKAAIVAMLDAKAKERRYDNALSLSTYVSSTNAAWAAEAATFVAWRDAIWAYCYDQLARVAIRLRTQPTLGEFMAEIAVAFPLTWPTP